MEGSLLTWRSFQHIAERTPAEDTDDRYFCGGVVFLKRKISVHPTARRLGIILRAFLIVSLALLALAVGYVLYATRGLDLKGDSQLYETYSRSLTTRLYVSEGGFREGAISEGEYRAVLYDSVCGAEDRVWCDRKDFPRHLKDAFIAIEDRRFYRHDGVDWLRTARAAANAVLRLEGRFGGSTITQQLVKNVSGERAPTLRRKVREILRATALEMRLSKEEILTYYLNVIPLANRCYGVGAAARYYFGKEPSELTLAESASIAAITNAPSRYDPVRFPEENRRRRDLILTKMAEYGFVGKEEADRAMQEPIRLDLSMSGGGKRIFGWYTEQVISDVTRDLTQRLGMSRESAERLVYLGGLRIYTLCDRELQETADRYLSHYDAGDAEGGVAVIDPRDGALLAVEGALTKKTVNRGQSYASRIKRPPGSALKPIALFAPALKDRIIHYASVLEDLPLEMKDGSLWPRNTPNVYAGRITAHAALASSKNTVAVRLYELLGSKRIADTLEDDFHIPICRNDGEGRSDLAPAPLALGQLTYGATLLDMTAAYGVFASGGVYRAPRSYLAVYAEDGRLLLDNPLREHRVLSEQDAFVMTQMLKEVVDGGTASSVTISSCIDTAAKTGTSSGARDRWMIGYTPNLLCGTFITGKEGAPSGGARQIRLWDDLMHRFHAPELSGTCEPGAFRMPRGVFRLPFCPDSGEAVGRDCLSDLRGARIELGYFTPDNAPRVACTVHTPILYDRLRGRFCPVPRSVKPSPFLFRASALRDENRRIPPGIEPLDRPYDLSVLLSDGDLPGS